MRRLLVIALLLALSPLPAFADKKAPARRAPRERDVIGQTKEKDQPVLQAPDNIESRIFFSDRPPERIDRRKVRETEILERMLRKREKLVVARRKEAIRQLERFVKRERRDSPQMPDALLRLAELRWEQARIVYLEAYDRWQKIPKARRPATPPNADIRVPLGLYDRILKEHPKFDRIDLVLYMKAYALIEAARTGEALEAYRRIIDEFPDSRFKPDAHMAHAEWHFTGNYDYAAALAEYQKVLEHPESELSDLALFKSAWCLWKLGRSKDAAKRFREVLDLSGRLKGVSGERRRRLIALQDEALEYLIQVFTEDEKNTAADLHGFLSEIGGEKYASRVLMRLSRTFFDQSRFDRAIEAYAMLLGREPDSPRAPEYQRQIASAYAALDDADNTIKALETLASTYKPGSDWAQRQADPEAIKRAERAAERAVRVQGLYYHERAQREKQIPDFNRAVELYRVHATHFPKSIYSYEITFYLAEILFHRLTRYDEAGRAYLQAARMRPKGEFTQDALYNAIIAFETVRVVELEGCRAPEPGKPLPPACGETETDSRFSEAIALYIELFPKDPEVPGILFRQGRMYFERGIYDPAVRQFGQLLESYPHSEHAAAAGELVLESFNRAKDYANIETWARRLKDAPAFQTAEAQRKLDGLILQSVFALGEQLAGKGEHEASAEAYLRAAHEFPRDKRAAQAYYNAGQEWQRAGKLDAAADAYESLIDKHPGSEEGALGAWSAAQMFESIAQFRDAARFYESYAESFPRGDKRADALYNAVVLRVTAGDSERAARDGRRFSELFPGHEAGDEVLFMIGRAHESAERWSEAASVYRRYARQGKSLDRRIEANTRLAQVLMKKGDQRGADRALRAATKPLKRKGRAKNKLTTGLYFAAQARFIQGDLVLAEFDRIRIEGDVKNLGKRLEKKSELLKKASAIYGDVVEYRVAEWVTAALFKIGQSYELFAESLREAPVPEGLNEEEEQAYRDQLVMFIVPIEERALEAYEGGYQKALELRVFNRWTQKLREGLTRLNDVEYPPLRELGGEIATGKLLPEPTPYEGLRRGEPAPQAVAQAPAPKPKKRAKRKARGRGGRVR
ncbi:MAG: tetratricopeptide repeat protein [Myxococcales bacterium]|nr:tetratricopeptide repeat protein [Myxococcales bacterium]